MSQRTLSRRAFLKASAEAGVAALLAACGSKPTPAPTTGAEEESSAPLPTEAPSAPQEDKVELVVWYQDWDGGNKIMDWAVPEFNESHPNVVLDMQRIGFSDLLSKLLPSIAAGTEGHVMQMFTDWIVATDVKQVFLDITEPSGGRAALEQTIWPAALSTVDTPEGRAFYIPWLAGIRGGALTVNADHMAEQSIDYLGFKTFEEVVDAGIALTQRNEDGKITRSGFSPVSSQYQLLWSLIWQLGGEFFDRETGTWSHNLQEGEEAAQMIYDLYWKHQTCDFELFTSEFDAVSQQLVSIWADGAWTAGVQLNIAEVPADTFATPRLANAVEEALYPQHICGFGLSKRLSDDPARLQAALDFTFLLVSPDALLKTLDFYSGTVMSKEVYEDPRVDDTMFGTMSKRVAEEVWPIARYPQDHVANHGPAATELDRAMRQEISIQEALANMDAYLQEQENEARERIGL